MLSGHTPLGPGAEFDRIRLALERLGPRAAGAGDDCAFVRVGGEYLALSCDASVEGTHFQPGWLRAEELGWRAAAAALSDLAAVAATPLGVLVSVALPAEWPEEHFAGLMDGVGEAVEAVGALVWGGDVVRGERLAIGVFVAGRLAGEPVRRRGATPGDGLWVTGRLGGPGAAVAAWTAGREPEATARDRFARPEPRVQEARWLKEHGAKAMIDVSDGVLPDAAHLAAASGVRWTIALEALPLHPAIEGPLGAVVSGEEYELLVALPPDFGADQARQFEAAFGLPLTRVGWAEPAGPEPLVRLVQDGVAVEPPVAFAHF
jgi:thiamine-monophosphate kinase